MTGHTLGRNKLERHVASGGDIPNGPRHNQTHLVDMAMPDRSLRRNKLEQSLSSGA